MRVVWKETREKLRRIDYFEKLPQDGDTAKETRIFQSSDRIKQDWERAYNAIEETEKHRAFGIAKLTFISKISFYFFMLFIIIYSLFKLSAGEVGPDLLLIIFTFCLNISNAVSSVPRSYQQLDYGLYGLDIQRRFFEQTMSNDPSEEQRKASTPLNEDICFEVQDMSFAYSNGKSVLKNLNFQIKKGETIALVGSNGSGKTTLVKVLLGLFRPTAGKVKFMGRGHDEYKKDFITNKVGVFFQDFYLFHFTLGENVGIGNVKEIRNESMITNAVEQGGALKVLQKLKKGLSHRLGKQVYKDGAILSGGEQQRVAVSRTHMSDKDIMIFDEPASMLDPIAEMEQFFNIKKKLGGRTSILISHRIGFARLANRILVLDKGAIVEDGTHDELMKKQGVYAELFQEQARWYDKDGGGEEE